MVSNTSLVFMLISGIVSFLLPFFGIFWIMKKARGSAYVAAGGAATNFIVYYMLGPTFVLLILYWLPYAISGSPAIAENQTMPSVFGSNLFWHEFTATSIAVILEVLFIFLAMRVGLKGQRTGVSALTFGFGYAVTGTFLNCAIKSAQYFIAANNINMYGFSEYIRLSKEAAAGIEGATEQTIAEAGQNAETLIKTMSEMSPFQFLYPLVNAVLLTAAAVSIACLIYLVVFKSKTLYLPFVFILDMLCKLPPVYKNKETTSFFNAGIDIFIVLATALMCFTAWYLCKRDGFNLNVEPKRKFEGSSVLDGRHRLKK